MEWPQVLGRFVDASGSLVLTSPSRRVARALSAGLVGLLATGVVIGAAASSLVGHMLGLALAVAPIAVLALLFRPAWSAVRLAPDGEGWTITRQLGPGRTTVRLAAANTERAELVQAADLDGAHVRVHVDGGDPILIGAGLLLRREILEALCQVLGADRSTATVLRGHNPAGEPAGTWPPSLARYADSQGALVFRRRRLPPAIWLTAPFALGLAILGVYGPITNGFRLFYDVVGLCALAGAAGAFVMIASWIWGSIRISRDDSSWHVIRCLGSWQRTISFRRDQVLAAELGRVDQIGTGLHVRVLVDRRDEPVRVGTALGLDRATVDALRDLFEDDRRAMTART